MVILDEQLLCECEIGNVMDQFAVVAKTLVVYFCFSFGKSQYSNKVHKSRLCYVYTIQMVYVANYEMMCIKITQNLMMQILSNARLKSLCKKPAIWYSMKPVFTILCFMITLYQSLSHTQYW